MKNALCVMAVLCAVLVSGRAESFFDQAGNIILERGPHYTVVQNAFGDQYVEMASGLNYLKDGQWQPSSEQIEIFTGGALFRQGAFSLVLDSNANTTNAVDLLTPEGARLQSTVYGLALTDASTGQAVLLGSLKNSTGQQTAPNEITYPDAFNGVSADLRYRVTRAGLEQDVVLTGLSTNINPALYQMTEENARLQVFTEFFNPPQPALTAVSAGGGETNQAAGDTQISFGATQIGQGRAFLNLPGTEGINVTRVWAEVQGRYFLIESIPFKLVEDQLLQLPLVAAGRQSAPPRSVALKDGSARSLAAAAVSLRADRRSAKVARPVQVAQAREPRREFVWDYVLQNSATNLTFASGSTYYISGLVALSGTTILESGAILKFSPTNSAQIQLSANTDCRTAQYREAIVTARDDDSVGAVINGSTGSPTGYYAYKAFSDNAIGAYILHDLRISYAQIALNILTDNGGCQLYNGQIINCSNAVVASTAMFGLKNVLVNNATTAFAGTTPNSGFFDQVTFDHCQNLVGGTGNGYFTNCLVANVTNLVASGGSLVITGSYNGFYASSTFGLSTVSSSVSPFTTLLAGSHYLASASVFQAAGTTNENPIALTALQTRTTWPPIVLGGSVTLNTVITPQAPRGMGTPSLGYYYDPLDYVASGLTVSNATLLCTNGTAIGFYGTNGVTLQSGAQLVSEGNPFNPNEFCIYSSVQESPSTLYGNGTSWTLLQDDATSGTNTQIFLRFTEASLNSVSENNTNTTAAFFSGKGKLSRLALQDSALFGAKILFTNGFTFAATNTLFEHPFVSLGNGLSNSIVAHGRNNLFVKQGWLTLAPASGNSWSWYDNVFNITNISQNASSISNDYNAYIAGAQRLTNNGTHDLVLTSLTNVVGPLGWYYLPPNSPLLGAGSRTSDTAGLYHFTTQLSEMKETNSTVDIGLHYVALQVLGASNVWVEDAIPAGATATADVDGWNWVTTGPNPYSGTKSHQAPNHAGSHQHYFTGATTTLVLAKGESLFTYLYLDSTNTPTQAMLQVHDDYYWVHRPYWGTGTPAFGPDGTDGARYMGPLPAAGGWARLDVSENAVGLRGINISGMAFTLVGGKATWDYTGKGALIPFDSDGDGIPDYLENVSGSGTYNSGAGSGETDWLNSNSGISGTAALQVFTPLK